jgi:hypothetical protein
MRPPTTKPKAPGRRAALAATCLALAGLGASGAFASSGGLSVDPGILEHVASPGALGPLKISNTTSRPMKVHVAMRPWLQARSGSVTPNPRKLLGKLRPNSKSFWLAPGATRALGLGLASRPGGGSLYGAVEVTGAPKYHGAKGIKVAYRLVTSLRLFPPPSARRYRARAGRLFEHGSAKHGALFLPVKNAGNTIDPIGGRVRISGHNHTLSGIVEPKTVLPGATVNLRLARLSGTLPSGRYRVGVRLTQAGHEVAGFRHGIRLR